MIKGMGIDLTEIDRIQGLWDKYGLQFARKILTDEELTQLSNKRSPVNRLAALFAAKEAAVKALGTGFADGVHFKCIEILHAPNGKPGLTFLGRGKEVFNSIGATTAHITLTHSRDTAAAMVVIEE